MTAAVEKIAQDLIIISPDRVSIRDLVQRFPDLSTRYEIRVDRRWHERRDAQSDARYAERRHGDRRQVDITERLQRDGWALVPAAQRAP